MARWQYRLRYTNLHWGDGGPRAQWRDVTPMDIALDIRDHSSLLFRRKPRRSPASLVGAVLRRAGNKQQRREA